MLYNNKFSVIKLEKLCLMATAAMNSTGIYQATNIRPIDIWNILRRYINVAI